MTLGWSHDRAALLAAAGCVVWLLACTGDASGSQDDRVDVSDPNTDVAVDGGAGEDGSGDREDGSEVELGSGDLGGDLGGDADDSASPDEGPEGVCGPIGRRRLWAIRAMRFSVELEPGVSRGFDMDAFPTGPTDGEGCGKPDFRDPDGTVGIDNQFARLLPALDAATGEPADGAIARAIEEAELILLVELESVDDLVNDDCVSLTIFRAGADVVFGTDGLLLPGQSYELDTTRPWARFDRAEIRDGVLTGGPFALELPLSFFSTNLTVSLGSTWLRASVDSAGNLDGLLGGAAGVEALLSTAQDIDPGFVGIAETLLGANADLFPDESGDCAAISITWEFSAAPGHLYADAVRPTR